MTVDVIDRFAGQYDYLSNFYSQPGLEDRLWGFPSAEHAFQAAKTLDRDLRLPFRGRGLTPAGAKRAGRKLALRPDWESVRLDVMFEILSAKFSHPNLARLLRATGEIPLIEGNSWHDQFWGDCHCDLIACFPEGRNNLGRLLEQVRSNLA